jgi:imidazoleglycerol-phosphate dehydratase
MHPMSRVGKINRKTTETEIAIEIGLDGAGKMDGATTLPFLDHMLNLFARHGFFDLSVSGRGDTSVDDHHLVEDLGICLGAAVKQALGDKQGIARYGAALVPMDETLCSVAIDISGRPYLIYHAAVGAAKIGAFDPALIKEFFKSFSDHSGITLHINVHYGSNNHHIVEAMFKAFARALHKAVTLQIRIEGVLSTKGSL